MSKIDIPSDNPLLLRLRELKQETDFEFVLELIEIYLNETPKQIQTMSVALDANDPPALAIIAHKLKGSSMNLGAEQLGAFCLKLEELGRSGKPIPEGTSTREIEVEFEQIKILLQEFKQSAQ
jgi:HPt (histidine-containing phosphotransfer) domain-containing protein